MGVCYSNNYIYITDRDKHCLHLMDLNLNIIRSFGSIGSGNQNFKYPLSICIENNLLYVTDCKNKRIQVFNNNFEFIDGIKLTGNPFSIKFSDKTIGICSSNGVYFYDITTKTLKNEYKNIIGKMNSINNNFYLLSNQPLKRLYCYDNDGNLVEEIINKSFDKLIENNTADGCILNVTASNLMYMTSVSKKCIYRIN